jgi:flagellar hook-basal body complex protein FliE
MSNIDLMVNQLRAVAAQTAIAPARLPEDSVSGRDFSSMLKTAIDEVNGAQQEAKLLTRQFEAGKDDVNLQDVVMSLQKASLSFQTMVQVRNKLVTAYQEVMNMQV